jgi:stage II sporulation protein AA (anti-sigma F factor antagonist)
MPLFDRLGRPGAGPGATPLAVAIQVDRARVAHLSTAGELDLLGEPVLEDVFEQVLGMEPGRIVLDMASVTFMDASGARLLHRLATRAADSGVLLTIRNLDGEPRRALELTGLTALLVLEDD